MSIEIAGLIELTSIAQAYITLDDMVKMAPIDILKAEAVNPGRFLIIISGDVASVESAMNKALETAGESSFDHTLLRNLHEKVLQAVGKAHEPENWDAIGLLETTSVVSAVEAADYAVKIADVEVVEIVTSNEAGGKGLLKLNGPVGDINYAIETVAEKAREKDRLFRAVVIPGPHSDIKGFVSGN